MRSLRGSSQGCAEPHLGGEGRYLQPSVIAALKTLRRPKALGLRPEAAPARTHALPWTKGLHGMRPPWT